jgi:8-oxo-dGTP diphosphatase
LKGFVNQFWLFGFNLLGVIIMIKPEVPIVLVAALALFDRDGRVLLAQRPEGKSMAGLWELPGGKVEAGEMPERALCREVREELGITVLSEDLAPLTFASYRYEHLHLLMPVWAAIKWRGEPVAREGQGGIAWVDVNQLDSFAMPAADLPLIPAIRGYAASMVHA